MIKQSEDNEFVISGADDRSLKLWNVQTGECVRTFIGHEDAVYSVSFSSDNQFVISGS
jgi:WD40 repeat protein